MTISSKATRIRLGDFSSAPMRAFHMTWMAFFLCFFGWFGIAPLMPIIRDEFHLTKAQIGNLTIGSVAITVLVRLLIGWLCDRVGPRRAYVWLLTLGSIPVMCVGLASGYESFLIFRVLIGAIGASFVITQFHTSVMFAPNVVGAANATVAGWGNLGGGVTQIAMPLLFSAFMAWGAGSWWSWRLAMFVPGVALFFTGIAYYFLTQDTPDGNWKRKEVSDGPSAGSAFLAACGDKRVWALAVLYAACFGMELTIDNIAALYFTDYFHLGLKAAGAAAAAFGMMNLFARALGGWASDRCYANWGLGGRAKLLCATILCEGGAFLLFSQMRWLPAAIAAMMFTGLFIKMSNGATYAVVPFVNKKALGGVAGIVGAGGNVGAVLAGFLFKMPNLAWPNALAILGGVVACSSVLALMVRFSEADEQAARKEIEARLGMGVMGAQPVPVAGD